MDSFIVAPSAIAGKGLFATRRIKKNEVIMRIEGPIIRRPFFYDYRVDANGVSVGRHAWKVPYRHSHWRYINHCCVPNAGLSTSSTVVAMKDIQVGEEITIDYACAEAGLSWKMKCACARYECRKVIRSVQHLPMPLFKKYQHYIPRLLQNLYRRYKVYIATPANGTRGVFAKSTIRKGEVLFKVEGSVIKYDKAPPYQIGFHWLALGKNTWLMPMRQNPWWSLRHSCSPNIGIKDKVYVVAMRSIHPNEELTIDDSITEADPNWRIICECGKKSCRKVVRSVQYLSPRLFKKYEPYVPTYIKQVYISSQKRATVEA
jgi:hypothetical protein